MDGDLADLDKDREMERVCKEEERERERQREREKGEKKESSDGRVCERLMKRLTGYNCKPCQSVA